MELVRIVGIRKQEGDVQQSCSWGRQRWLVAVGVARVMWGHVKQPATCGIRRPTRSCYPYQVNLPYEVTRRTDGH